MNALSDSIRKHQYLCNLSCPPFPAAASQHLRGLSTIYRTVDSLQRLSHSRLKETIFPLFMSSTSPYFGDSSGRGSTNVSLKSNEDGSEFSNYSSQNNSNYSQCIVLILCCILLQVLLCTEAPFTYAHQSVSVYVRQDL